VLRAPRVSLLTLCPLAQECGAPHSCANVKLLGMWSWHAKASQIADSGISNFTFLLASARPPACGLFHFCEIPMLHSLFLRAHCRFLSLPLLGSVADGFSDWLAANGYTRVSRQNSIRMLPNVDADLRRRQVEELAKLPNRFSAIVDGLSARTVLSQQKPCGHWNDIWPRTA